MQKSRPPSVFFCTHKIYILKKKITAISMTPCAMQTKSITKKSMRVCTAAHFVFLRHPIEKQSNKIKTTCLFTFQLYIYIFLFFFLFFFRFWLPQYPKAVRTHANHLDIIFHSVDLLFVQWGPATVFCIETIMAWSCCGEGGNVGTLLYVLYTTPLYTLDIFSYYYTDIL